MNVGSFGPAGLADVPVALATRSFLRTPIMPPIRILAIFKLRVERTDAGSVLASTRAKPTAAFTIQFRRVLAEKFAAAFASNSNRQTRPFFDGSVLAVPRAMLAAAKLGSAGRYFKRFLAPLTISCNSFTHGKIMGHETK